MIYTVVLSWNGVIDTINCVKSLMNLNYDDYKITIVDNCSTDNSYDSTKENLNALYITGKSFIEAKYEDRSKYQILGNDKIILIQSPRNNGYASGNNTGIELVLNQEDTKYVWVLNNDTEMDKEALTHLTSKCDSDKNIGIYGSRLVYFTDKEMQQGPGGVHNRWLCTTKSYETGRLVPKKYDDEVASNNIDYIIGASMFFSRECLETVGLMNEEYSLYYEELDICLRTKVKNFKLGICSDSLVYYKMGISTDGGKSIVADLCLIKNRLVITEKFYLQYYQTVWLSLPVVALNRTRRGELNKMKGCLNVMFSPKRNKGSKCYQNMYLMMALLNKCIV